jgi:hypothetical protein
MATHLFNINTFYLVAILFSLVTCALNLRRLQPDYLKYFLWFLLLALPVETAGYYTKSQRISNHLLYNVFFLIEFTFLNFIYYRAIPLERVRKVIRVYSLFFIGLFVANATFVQGWQMFNSNMFLVGGLGVLAWIGIYFVRLLTDPQLPELRRQPLFWISTGLLFFFPGITPIYGMLNYLNEHYQEVAKQYFAIIPVLFLIKYALLGVGFLCGPRKLK